MQIKHLLTTCLATLAIPLCAQDLYFNTNDLASDLVGDFEASVLLAQNSIIPSKNSIPGDVQPRLASKRKTLIMVKPKIEWQSTDVITLTVTNESDPNLTGNFTLQSPEYLPPIAGINPDIDLSSVDFSLPSFFDRTIQGSTQLNSIKDDTTGQLFDQYLSNDESVRVRTADGQWISDFYLPQGDSYSKKVVFISDAGYASRIHFDNRSVNISRGDTLVFSHQEGQWVQKGDLQLGQIKYGEGYWTAVIPGQFILPGIQLSFAHNNQTASLSDLPVGGYTQVLIHTINLGMLTPYERGMLFQSNSEYQRQYFQQIPASQLIVSAYEPQHFEEVMLPDGTFLDSIDYTSDGGIYTGAMREAIGKKLVSQGIDLANYGIFSSTSQSEVDYLAAQVTAHKSRGHYRNGIQEHGLSGGAGMATLSNTIGNEWSHELGHNWGMGHFPGGFEGSVHRPADQINSTWGWDSDSNYFIPNFNNIPNTTSTCVDESCQEPWNGFQFNKDAMAGGSPTFESFNRFTLHTPYVLEKIQKFYERKMVFAPHQTHGFEKWNSSLEEMRSFEHKAKINNDSIPMKPKDYGVPVTTIVGYYDPQRTLSSYIYPALYGSYGMYYEAPANVTTECQVEVSLLSGSTLNFPLNDNRFNNSFMNKFHINVPTSMNPQSAQVICNQQQQAMRVFQAPSFELTANKLGLGQLEEETTSSIHQSLSRIPQSRLVQVNFLDQHYEVHLAKTQESLSIVNLQGQKIIDLRIQNNQVNWNGISAAGERVPSGVYYFNVNGFKKPLIIQ